MEGWFFFGLYEPSIKTGVQGTFQKHNLKEKLMEAYTVSQKVQLGQVLKQKI